MLRVAKFNIVVLCCLFFSHSAYANEPLTWAGCGITKKAFMSELAIAYQKEFGTEIILEGGGATKGIRRTNNNEVDIGGSCRAKIPGHPKERRARLHPVAWDALVVIVHKDNPVTDINTEQLQAIFKGEMTSWKDLGLAEKPIDLQIRKGKHSGVGRTLRQILFADVDMSFPVGKIHASTGPLEQEVEKNVNAIAVSGISSAKKRDVKILTLNGKKPDYENIRNGQYMLYRPLYIVSNFRNPRKAEVRQFISFANSPKGREIIRNQGVVPYRDALTLVLKQREQNNEAREKRLSRE